MDLTAKERLFVVAYLGEAKGNAAKAARIAGYKDTRVTPTRLLAKASIKAAIEEKLDKASASANEVLAMLSEIAWGGLGPFLKIDDRGGWSVDLRKAKKAGRLGLLKKLKATEFGTEVEVYSRIDAIDRLARYHGLYDARITQLTQEINDLERRTRDKESSA